MALYKPHSTYETPVNLFSPTFMRVCVSLAQRNGLENSACSCKKCNRQLEKERVKKQGSFCLQQPRFYPLVAECCLALQISAQAWTDTGGLSWPCSALSASPPPLPVLHHANKPEWESSWEGERERKDGGGKRDGTQAGRRNGEGAWWSQEGREWRAENERDSVCVFMVDRKKGGGGGGGVTRRPWRGEECPALAREKEMEDGVCSHRSCQLSTFPLQSHGDFLTYRF